MLFILTRSALWSVLKSSQRGNSFKLLSNCLFWLGFGAPQSSQIQKEEQEYTDQSVKVSMLKLGINMLRWTPISDLPFSLFDLIFQTLMVFPLVSTKLLNLLASGSVCCRFMLTSSNQHSQSKKLKFLTNPLGRSFHYYVYDQYRKNFSHR